MLSTAQKKRIRSISTALFFSIIVSMPLSMLAPVSPAPARDTGSRAIVTMPVEKGMDIPEVEPRYLILCPAIFKEETIPLAVHRTRSGLPTEIYGIEDIVQNRSGRDRRESVHDFLREYSRENPTFQWLLIMGDSEFLRPRELWHYAEDRFQPFANTFHSDVYYAGLDSDWDDDGDRRYGEVYSDGRVEADTDWDVYVGRVPASTEEHVENYVSKLIAYERNPPVGTWMKRFYNWGSVMEPPNRVNVPNDPNNYYAYKSNAYKVCRRVNDHLPEHIVREELYDYPQLEAGNYTVGDGRDTLHRDRMISDFNRGASMLNFAGQARYDATALNDYGPPTGNGYYYVWNEPMSYRDHSIFTNGNMLPFMYASTCDTAKFFRTGVNEDRSLETWVTTKTGGVIGLISSTNTSARGEERNRSWGNWYLDELFWKLFLREGGSRAARTMFRVKEIYEDEWYSPSLQIKETIMGMIYGYILLGEPYVDIYTDVAERFPSDLADDVDIYQGNHTVRFRVEDRNGDPVPNATVTLYSHSTYRTLKADSKGLIHHRFDPMGDDTLNMTIAAHNMVTKSFVIDVKDEISDLVADPDSLMISPREPEHGGNITVSFNISNAGGMTAMGSAVRIDSSPGHGGNWSPLDEIDIGDLEAHTERDVDYTFSAQAGTTRLRFTMTTLSPEIDLLNNEVEATIEVPPPHLTFEQGTGIIRPSSVVRPGSMISVEYDVFNEGPAPGRLFIGIYLGSPEENGTPITDTLDLGMVQVNLWNNGTIDLRAPDSSGLLYLVMDPLGEYRRGMCDDPVKSLLEVNTAPRITRNLSLVILEDSGENTIRIDDAFDDTDNTSSEISYSLSCGENLTCSLSEDANGTFATLVPHDDFFGNSTVRIEANDGLGMVSEMIEVTVMPVNDAPYFVNAKNGRIEMTMVEDSPFNLMIEARDKEDDGITFTAEGAPFDLDPETGELAWTPAQKDVGVSSWEIMIEDEQGAASTAEVVIEVLLHNDPPSVTGLKDVTVSKGETSRMEITVVDEEGDEVSIVPSHPFVRVLRNELVTVEWSEGYQKPVDVSLEITDGVNTVYSNFTVKFQHEGEGDGKDPEGGGADTGMIIAGIGVAAAAMAVLLALFLIIRKTKGSRKAEEEMAEADLLYMRQTGMREE